MTYFLKKVYYKSKQYWWLILLVLLAFFYFISGRRGSFPYKDLYDAKVNDIKKQMEIMDKAHLKKKEVKTKLEKKYKETIEEIEKAFVEQKMVLKRTEKKEIERIIKDINKDPELKAKELAHRFGFEYVESHD